MQKKLPLINSAHGSETRNIINELIKLFNSVGYTYDEALRKAQSVLNEAKKTNDMNKDVQSQVNKFISEFESTGETNLEIIQSRSNFDVLNDRISAQERNTEIIASDARTAYKNEPLVSFVFDDGKMPDWDRFKPIFESEGVPGCVNLIVENVGKNGYMTWEQAIELKNMGWTVSSHTMSHSRLANLNNSQLEYELSQSAEALRSRGLDHDIIVYPFGSINDEAKAVAKKYFKMGVNIIRSGSNEFPDVENLDFVRVPGLSQPRDHSIPNSEPTLAECKAMVDEAIEKNKYIIFEDHSHYSIYDSQTKLNELRELIQYIKSKNVPIVNLQEGYQMRANVVEADDYKLHRSGRVIAKKQVSHLLLPNNEKTLSDGADEFQVNAITTLTVTDFTGLPFNVGGNLITYKETANAAQWFQEHRSTIGTLERYWDHNNKKWTDWRGKDGNLPRFSSTSMPEATIYWFGQLILVTEPAALGDGIYACVREPGTGQYNWTRVNNDNNIIDINSAVDAYTTATPPSGFPSGKIIHTRISSSNTDIANFPGGVGGTLITNVMYRVSGANYPYQEYHAYNGKLFRRTATSSGWGTFKELQFI